MMLPALKLSLNGFKLRDHPLLRRNPPNDESSAAVELPTEVSETQEREGFWFPLPHGISGLGQQTARIQSVVSCPHVIPIRTCQPFPKLLQEPLGVRPVLKAHHKIIGIADDNHFAACDFLAPDLNP